MYVIDCRAKLAAQANMLKGAGFENPEYYDQCHLEFMGIENIHSKSLLDTCHRLSY
jgi:hypothetical protein